MKQYIKPISEKTKRELLNTMKITTNKRQITYQFWRWKCGGRCWHTCGHHLPCSGWRACGSWRPSWVPSSLAFQHRSSRVDHYLPSSQSPSSALTGQGSQCTHAQTSYGALHCAFHTHGSKEFLHQNTTNKCKQQIHYKNIITKNQNKIGLWRWNIRHCLQVLLLYLTKQVY